MKISIIIPVYNVEPYIKDCLDSVISQHFDGQMECILVDDCGKDKSIDIAEHIISDYAGQINFQIIHHEHNKGISEARNTGIRAAKGDYVLFLDSDDVLMLNCVSRLINVAEKHPDAQLIQGSTISEITNGFILSKSVFPDYSDDINWIRRGFCTFLIPDPAWNRLVNLEFLKNNNLYFDEGYIQEDTLWSFRLQKCVTKIAFCFYPTYWYRLNNEGIMHGTGKEKEAKSFARVFNKIYDEIKDAKTVTPFEIEYLEIIARRIISSIGKGGCKLLETQKNRKFNILLSISLKKQNLTGSGIFRRIINKLLRICYGCRLSGLRNELCNMKLLYDNYTHLDY